MNEARKRSLVAIASPTLASIEFGECSEYVKDELSAINEALGRGAMAELDPSKRGAADISFVAPYTDALAGLGALGEGGHTPHESLELTSMPLAIKRAAILIYRLSKATD